MASANSLFGKKGPSEPKKKQSLFGSKPSSSTAETTQNLANDVSSLSSRIRMIEERYDNLRRKTQVTDQNMLMNQRKVVNEMKTFQSSITEMKRDINDIKEKIRMIIKDLNESAKKEDITVLQKYINLWEPVNFVTRNEVKQILKEELSELEEKNKTNDLRGV